MIRQLLFLLLILPLMGTSQELKELRLEYAKAAMDKDSAETLLKSLTEITSKDEATLVAYKGALLTIKAQNSKGVGNKISYFKEGKVLLEQAISKQPKNIEIRCLRIGVQENSPKIVRYKSNIDDDKKFLIDNYTAIKNQEIKVFIRAYVAQSALFSDSEKQLF